MVNPLKTNVYIDGFNSSILGVPLQARYEGFFSSTVMSRYFET